MSDDFYSSPKLQMLINGAKGKWVYLIMAKWYLLIAVPAFWAAYHFFDKFEKTGIPSKIHDFISLKLDMLVNITKQCTPLIGNLSSFFECLNSIN